jgi:hypothetical protein
MDNFAKNTIFINMLLFFIYYTKIFKWRCIIFIGSDNKAM